MNPEPKIHSQAAELFASLFGRGSLIGTAGNVSAHVPDGILTTPPNSSLGSFCEQSSFAALQAGGPQSGLPAVAL